MKKKKNFFINIFLIFLCLNVIITLIWPLRTYIKFKYYNPYSKEFVSSLNIGYQNSKKLYLETWQRERLLVYEEYTGFKESPIDGEFLNITNENGRMVPNQKIDCSNSIYFYGSEDIFGYDVTDEQTIPSYFNKLLKNKNYCVYNYGRWTYNSTQENILFQLHLLKKKIKENDILIFLDGNNEKGTAKLLNTEFINKNYNKLHKKFWNLYTTGFDYFFNLLPVTQFINVMLKKVYEKNNSKFKYDTPLNYDEIKSVFNRNIEIRKSLCDRYNLKCFNFILFKKHLINQKYEVIKEVGGVIDLNQEIITQDILVNRNGSLYPETNKIISLKIFNKIFVN